MSLAIAMMFSSPSFDGSCAAAYGAYALSHHVVLELDELALLRGRAAGEVRAS